MSSLHIVVSIKVEVKMLDKDIDTGNVKFVSYTGKYPGLCCGILTLNIDGKDYTWENGLLYSGGAVYVDGAEECVTYGEWIIRVDEIPDEIKKYAHEIDKVVNKNIEHGCCGGCM